MARLRLAEPVDATGPLRDEYDATVARAGKVDIKRAAEGVGTDPEPDW